MPYAFHEWEEELEPEASSARGGRPPGKRTAIGVVDPPVPPRKPLGPLAALPSSFLLRVLAGVILAGIGLFILFLLSHP